MSDEFLGLILQEDVEIVEAVVPQVLDGFVLLDQGHDVLGQSRRIGVANRRQRLRQPTLERVQVLDQHD